MKARIPPDCLEDLRQLVDKVCAGQSTREEFLNGCAAVLMIENGDVWPQFVHLTVHFLDDQDIVGREPGYGESAYAGIIQALVENYVG